MRLGIHRSNCVTPLGQFKFWLLAVVSLLTAIVEVVSFGFLSAEWRVDLLFSKWMDNA